MTKPLPEALLKASEITDERRAAENAIDNWLLAHAQQQLAGAGQSLDDFRKKMHDSGSPIHAIGGLLLGYIEVERALRLMAYRATSQQLHRVPIFDEIAREKAKAYLDFREAHQETGH